MAAPPFVGLDARDRPKDRATAGGTLPPGNGATGFASPSAGNAHRANGHNPTEWWDLAVCLALVVGSGAAALGLPEGTPLRVVLAIPVLLLVPGFLLLEVALGPATWKARSRRLLVAVGVSPVLVGLSALGAAIVPGGFRPLGIVIAVTSVCLGLAVGAYLRRSRSSDATRPLPSHLGPPAGMPTAAATESPTLRPWPGSNRKP